MEVPTVGILIKVGTKVPIILPMVLDAFSIPTTLPLSSSLSTQNLTKEGVTVPIKNNGKTKITIQAMNPASIRKLLFTVNISKPDITTIIYFPSTGIAAIQIAAKFYVPLVVLFSI